MKKSFIATSENTTINERNISDINEKLFGLEKSNIALKSKVSRLEEEIFSNTFVTDEVIRYDRAFQHFLAKSIDRSKMASMIYGVSRNEIRGLGVFRTIKEN